MRGDVATAGLQWRTWARLLQWSSLLFQVPQHMEKGRILLRRAATVAHWLLLGFRVRAHPVDEQGQQLPHDVGAVPALEHGRRAD